MSGLQEITTSGSVWRYSLEDSKLMFFQVPMVAPFFGCTFGGFLYDMLMFTGDSPINTPYLGFYRFIPGMKDMKDQVQTWKDREEGVEESPV